MLFLDKDTNVLDDKKEAVVTTPLSEKKWLKTENVTTSDKAHKRTEKITTGEEVFKGADEVHKHTENIAKNEEVDKGTEELEDMKEAVVKIRRKDPDKFEGHYKGTKWWFNTDHEFKKRKLSALESDFYTKIYEKDIEGLDMEPYKKFFVPFDSTMLNLNNINNPVKNRAPSSDKEKKAKDTVVAPICGEITLPKEYIKTQKVTNGTKLIIQS